MKQYIISLVLIMVVFTPVYMLVRKPWKHKGKREYALAVFWLFHIGLFALALQGNQGQDYAIWDLGGRFLAAAGRIKSMEGINLVPFHTICRIFRYFEWDAFLINIVGNIVMFMPWGFGLPLLWKANQSWGRILPMVLGITLFIEVSQLFIGRSVDVDDLLLNFAGGCLGAAAYFGLRRRCSWIADYGEESKIS